MRRLVHRDAPATAGVTGASSRIKAWMRGALSLGPDVILSVTELSCAEVGCPPRETVILVLPAGCRAMKYSVHKGLADVVEEDILACIATPPVML
jgi:hypothetical protein